MGFGIVNFSQGLPFGCSAFLGRLALFTTPQPSLLSDDPFGYVDGYTQLRGGEVTEADLFVKLGPYQFRMPAFFRSLRHLSPAVLAARLDFLMCRDHGYRLGTFFAALKGVIEALRGVNPEDIAALPLQALVDDQLVTI